MADALETTLRYYGVSPWEIEVLYGFLNSHFKIVQKEIEQDDEDYVSFLEVNVPLAFDEGFFQWFEFKRWEKVKAVFKEMKRRRGSGNALRVRLNFAGTPRITFSIDSEDKQWFDNAIEKIDFVLELLPYHLDPAKLPQGASLVSYKFDTGTIRWRLDSALAGGAAYAYRGDGWKQVS